MKNKIFNIPLSCSFVDVIANRFLEEYKDNLLELSDVLFLLPNRRACKSLQEAFVRAQGLKPTLLPKIAPIGDFDEEELFLTGFNSAKVLEELKPSVSKTERLLLFTRLIMARNTSFGGGRLSAAQSCFLAQELAGLIDKVNNEQLSFNNLEKLVPDEYSQHWQETLELLSIITKFWPAQLEELGKADPSFRKNQMLEIQNKIWKENPPQNRIVIAGTTATYPLMKELVKTVLGFEKSELILSGLDKSLDEEDWEDIDETHPQFELKGLLEFLEVSRFEVKDFVEAENKGREVLISEIMRPARTTHKWRDIAAKNIKQDALNGINIVNCSDIREEALSIAMIMREALETPEITAALVTSDRNLARRVAAELERWEIKVDDSAGKPLALTPIGQFLRLIVKCVNDDYAPVSFLSLLKHPFCTNGMDYAEVRKFARDYEKKVLRGESKDDDLEAVVESFKNVLCELKTVLESGKSSFKEMLSLHIKTAENLAGIEVLWKGEAGEAAADFAADLYADASSLGEVNGRDYLELFEALMAGVTVRPKFGMHPRLKILGPIEARLNLFDIVIVGEVNEGVWPKNAGSDPWMSRPMKREFGISLPEQAIGVMGLDFCSFIGGQEVYLTRAERVQGTPMVKSRWLMRLETVLKALGTGAEKLENAAYKEWAKFLDKADVFKKIMPPMPKPPVEARPRELYASAVENLMRDPYIIFAKYILKLKPLEYLEKEADFSDYGNIVHEVLDRFNKKYPTNYPHNAREELIAIGQEVFGAEKLSAEVKAFWWPSFEKTAEWLSDKEKDYRAEVSKVLSEVKGSFSFDAPKGKFTISAKADRVDMLKNGAVNIVDYKTGQARKPKEVRAGYAPQLPIEGLIAKFGGFEGVPASEVEKLLYWRLGKEEVVIDGDVEGVLEKNMANIRKLIEVFDDENTAYRCRPNPQYAPKYSDYEHLARVKEWSVTGDADE